MKKLLFVLSMVLFSSCSGGFSLCDGYDWKKMAFTTFVGLVVGAILGYAFIKAPSYDYSDEKPSLRDSLPVILVWSVICGGLGCLVGAMPY